MCTLDHQNTICTLNQLFTHCSTVRRESPSSSRPSRSSLSARRVLERLRLRIFTSHRHVAHSVSRAPIPFPGVGLMIYRKPKNARSKRAMQAREPKEIEDPRTAIFVRGTHTGEKVAGVMKELVRAAYILFSWL